MTKKLLPLLLCLVVLFSCKNNQNKAEEALKAGEEAIEETAKDLAKDAKDLAKDATDLAKDATEVAKDKVNEAIEAVDNAVEDIINSETIFEQEKVTSAAILPFSKEDFPKYIAKNIAYENLEGTDIKGNIIADLIIEKDGSVSDVSIIKGINNGVNDAVVKCLKKLPKFTPGKIKDEAVRSKLRLAFPLTFKYL